MRSSPNSSRSSPAPRRVLIVDDHPVFRQGMKTLLANLPALAVSGEAGSMGEALEAVRKAPCDIAVVDINLPGCNGLELVKTLLVEYPRMLILVISCYPEATYAMRALRAGAKGYLTKAAAIEHVEEALRRITAGGVYVSGEFADRLVFKAIGGVSDLGVSLDRLSSRELEVFHLLGEGKSVRDTAVLLNLSVKTVETHRAHIREKLGFANSERLSHFAEEWVEMKDALSSDELPKGISTI